MTHTTNNTLSHTQIHIDYLHFRSGSPFLTQTYRKGTNFTFTALLVAYSLSVSLRLPLSFFLSTLYLAVLSQFFYLCVFFPPTLCIFMRTSFINYTEFSLCLKRFFHETIQMPCHVYLAVRTCVLRVCMCVSDYVST